MFVDAQVSSSGVVRVPLAAEVRRLGMATAEQSLEQQLKV
jgi:hypothetical protein